MWKLIIINNLEGEIANVCYVTFCSMFRTCVVFKHVTSPYHLLQIVLRIALAIWLPSGGATNHLRSGHLLGTTMPWLPERSVSCLWVWWHVWSSMVRRKHWTVGEMWPWVLHLIVLVFCNSYRVHFWYHYRNSSEINVFVSLAKLWQCFHLWTAPGIQIIITKRTPLIRRKN